MLHLLRSSLPLLFLIAFFVVPRVWGRAINRWYQKNPEKVKYVTVPEYRKVVYSKDYPRWIKAYWLIGGGR